MTNKASQFAHLTLAIGFGAFVAASFLLNFEPGQQMGQMFGSTVLVMLGLLPCAFVLIALFDVWVKRETIERHFGRGSGLRGYAWGILLAGMTVGGLYIAIPVAASLAKKGAQLSVVLAYLGFAGVCRIPMVMFEVSFMGWTFSAVRIAVSIPLIIVTSQLLGRVLEKRGYQVDL